MFLGYQNNIAAFTASTREELENTPCVSFDKIEEVVFAEMFNGVIYTSEEELIQAQTKAVEETRAGLYAAEVDPITSHINRLRDEEQTAEVVAKIAELVEERKLKVEEIKANNPYPAELVVDTVNDTVNVTEEPLVEPVEGSDNEVVELYSMEI